MFARPPTRDTLYTSSAPGNPPRSCGHARVVREGVGVHAVHVRDLRLRPVHRARGEEPPASAQAAPDQNAISFIFEVYFIVFL